MTKYPTIDRDDEETILQNSHREWAEDLERRQQLRDEWFVERFLRLKQLQSTSPTSQTVAQRLKQRSH
jgi:hypothetical protein